MLWLVGDLMRLLKFLSESCMVPYSHLRLILACSRTAQNPAQVLTTSQSARAVAVGSAVTRSPVDQARLLRSGQAVAANAGTGGQSIGRLLLLRIFIATSRAFGLERPDFRMTDS